MNINLKIESLFLYIFWILLLISTILSCIKGNNERNVKRGRDYTIREPEKKKRKLSTQSNNDNNNNFITPSLKKKIKKKPKELVNNNNNHHGYKLELNLEINNGICLENKQYLLKKRFIEINKIIYNLTVILQRCMITHHNTNKNLLILSLANPDFNNINGSKCATYYTKYKDNLKNVYTNIIQLHMLIYFAEKKYNKIQKCLSNFLEYLKRNKFIEVAWAERFMENFKNYSMTSSLAKKIKQESKELVNNNNNNSINPFLAKKIKQKPKELVNNNNSDSHENKHIKNNFILENFNKIQPTIIDLKYILRHITNDYINLSKKIKYLLPINNIINNDEDYDVLASYNYNNNNNNQSIIRYCKESDLQKVLLPTDDCFFCKMYKQYTKELTDVHHNHCHYIYRCKNCLFERKVVLKKKKHPNVCFYELNKSRYIFIGWSKGYFDQNHSNYRVKKNIV